MNRSVLGSALVVPFLVAAVACGGSGGESAAPTTLPSDADGGTIADAGRSTSSDVVADGSTAADGAMTPEGTISVHGTVTSYFDVPIVGRTVRVVDANGKHTDVVTDSAGGFAVLGIALPYDVRVSPEGLTDEATVYLGLADAAPYLHGEIATADAWVTQTFNVGVLTATACAGCEVDFVTKSPHGAGSASTNFPAGSSVAGAELKHEFVSDGSPSEPVTLHVLVHDAARTWFRYAEASLTAVAGRTSPGGLYSPDLVPVHPFAVSLQSAGVPANWRPELSVSVSFPDGAAINIFDGRGLSTVTTNVPAIPGASLSAYSWLVDPISDTDTTLSDNVQTRSGKLAISTPSVVLSPAVPLHDVVPPPKSTISLKGPGLSWTSAPATLTEVVLTDPSRRVAAIFTDGNSVTWDRLDALGVPVAPGDVNLILDSVPHTDLADVVASDPKMRTNLYDWFAPGSASYQRWTFTLTP